VHAWACGASWSEVIANTSLDEGDVVRVLRRTVDLLAQIPYCEAVSQQLRDNARRALKAINRFPVCELEDLLAASPPAPAAESTHEAGTAPPLPGIPTARLHATSSSWTPFWPSPCGPCGGCWIPSAWSGRPRHLQLPLPALWGGGLDPAAAGVVAGHVREGELLIEQLESRVDGLGAWQERLQLRAGGAAASRGGERAGGPQHPAVLEAEALVWAELPAAAVAVAGPVLTLGSSSCSIAWSAAVSGDCAVGPKPGWRSAPPSSAKVPL
jgi:hypothetical protein